MIIKTSLLNNEFDLFSFVDAKAMTEEKLACALHKHVYKKVHRWFRLYFEKVAFVARVHAIVLSILPIIYNNCY